jgi:hypothetical protein
MKILLLNSSCQAGLLSRATASNSCTKNIRLSKLSRDSILYHKIAERRFILSTSACLRAHLNQMHQTSLFSLRSVCVLTNICYLSLLLKCHIVHKDILFYYFFQHKYYKRKLRKLHVPVKQKFESNNTKPIVHDHASATVPMLLYLQLLHFVDIV